jgi:hypothetical protein
MHARRQDGSFAVATRLHSGADCSLVPAGFSSKSKAGELSVPSRTKDGICRDATRIPLQIGHGT